MSKSELIQHVLIMAAGRGVRMRPLTDSVPKAMAPFQGETLIANSIKQLRESINHIHVTVGYKSAMLAEYLMKIGVNSIFNTEGYPNSWWIHNTLLKYLDEPIFVFTCDNVIQLDFELLAHDYKNIGEPACMLVPVVPVKGLEGDFIDHDNGKVLTVQRDTPKNIYCSGIQVLNPHKVVKFTHEEVSFYDIWNQLIEHEQLYISSIYPKKWFAVDTIEQLVNVENQHIN
jgi:NDP-sugar pyrophosphorylase family protein